MIKKVLFFFSFFAFLNCSNNEDLNNCRQALPLNYTTDLNNPALINVLVPGGFVELTGGSKGILLGNVNGSEFIAYDKICPVGDCEDPMTFERGIVLKCACDKSEYGVGKGYWWCSANGRFCMSCNRIQGSQKWNSTSNHKFLIAYKI